MQRNIFRPDLEAFILVFPHHGCVVFEEFGGENAARASQEPFGFLGSFFIRAIIIAAALALAIVPMRDRMHRAVLGGPCLEIGLKCGRHFLEGDERVAAMLADEARVADIASEKRKHGGAAAG